jgi:hypothetical protein
VGDFGTGLRAHLSQRTHVPAPDDAALPPLTLGPELESLQAERRRLDERAAELAARELALAQREAELDAVHRRMALALANALMDAAAAANVPPPLDELAQARARRSAL